MHLKRSNKYKGLKAPQLVREFDLCEPPEDSADGDRLKAAEGSQQTTSDAS